MQAAPADAIVVCDVPLLAESPAAQARGYPVILVVEAPRDLRLERLAHRGVERTDAEKRMAAQATDEDRRKIATHLIDNSGDRAALERQVDEIWPDLERRRLEQK
jgi:dephospho-CoA kinase